MININNLIKLLNIWVDFTIFDNSITYKKLWNDKYKIICPLEKTLIKDIKKIEISETEQLKIDTLFFIFSISRLLYPNWKLFKKTEGEMITWKNNALYINKDPENIYIFENIDNEIGIKEKNKQNVNINSFFYIISLSQIRKTDFQEMLKIGFYLKQNKINIFNKKYGDNYIILYFLNKILNLNK